VTESEAVVTRLDGDHVWVELSSNCSSCAGSGGCGLSDGKGKRPQRIRNTVGAQVGDKVLLTIPDGAVLRAVFFCYALPLGCALLAAAGGMSLGGEIGSIVGAIAGLAVGWFGLRRFGQREPAPEIQLKPTVVNFHRNPQT
jgi:sigma-E factor negative regulatory protein RseC